MDVQNSSLLQDAAKTTPMIDTKEVIDFLASDTGATPNEISKVQANTEAKLQTIISAVAIQNLSRVCCMNEFLLSAEKNFYSAAKADLETDSDRLKSMIESAQKAMISILEFTRKFLVQNKDDMRPRKGDADDLALLLKSLPDDKVKKIKEMLEKGEI